MGAGEGVYAGPGCDVDPCPLELAGAGVVGLAKTGGVAENILVSCPSSFSIDLSCTSALSIKRWKGAHLPPIPPGLDYQFRHSPTRLHLSSLPHSHLLGRDDERQGRHTGVFMWNPDMYWDMILCASEVDR